MLFALFVVAALRGPISSSNLELLSFACGEFQSPLISPLPSTVNDVQAIASAIAKLSHRRPAVQDRCMEVLGPIRPKPVLAATKSQLLGMLRARVAKLVIFHFSGRGYRRPDPRRPGILSTYLMPYDTSIADGEPTAESMVSEDELVAAARTSLAAGTQRIVFLIDACYSAGLHLDFDPRVTALCSSGPDELSYDFVSNSNRRYGSFSYALATQIGRLESGITYAELLSKVVATMPRPSQARVVGDPDDLVFGFDSSVHFEGTLECLPDESDPSKFEVMAGDVDGITSEATFGFYSAKAGEESKLLFKSSPRSIGIASSTFDLPPGFKTAPLRARVLETVTTWPQATLSLGPIAGTAIGRDIAAGAKIANVRVVDAKGFATIRLDYPRDGTGQVLTTSAINVTNSAGAFMRRIEMSDYLPGMEQTPDEALVKMVAEYPRWQAIAALAPMESPIAVDLKLLRCTSVRDSTTGVNVVGSIGADVRSRQGSSIAVDSSEFVIAIRVRKVHPTAGDAWYLRVNDLMPDGTGAQLFPAAEAEDPSVPIAADGRWRFLGRASGHRPATLVDGGSGPLPAPRTDPSSIAAYRFDGLAPGTVEVIKALVSPAPMPFESMMSQRGGDDNPIFQFSVNSDGSVRLAQSQTGWAVATATILGVQDEEIQLTPPKATSSLIVGIDRYRNQNLAALHAVRDAKRVASFVESSAFGPVDQLNLLDGSATRAAVVDGLTGRLRKMPNDSLAIVYFGGHSMQLPGGGGALLLVDSLPGIDKPFDIPEASLRSSAIGSGITTSSLKRLLGSISAKRIILILDTSWSSGAESWASRAADDARTSGQSLLVVCTNGQAYEDIEKGGELTTGLLEAANDSTADADRDGMLTASELKSALKRRTTVAGASPRTAVMAVLQGSDFVVCKAPSTAGRSLLLRSNRRWQPPLNRAGSGAPIEPNSEGNLGKSYALMVGCDTYDAYGKLNNPLRDIHRIGKTLQDLYGFDVRYLENPGLVKAGELKKKPGSKQIISAINDFRDPSMFKLHPEDQVLIYYAGHGEFIVDEKLGFILPSDSIADDPTTPRDERLDDPNRLPLSDLLGSANGLKANHVMVVLDACFAGTSMKAVQQNPLNISLYLNPNRSRAGGSSPLDALESFALAPTPYCALLDPPLTADQIARIRRKVSVGSRIVVSSGDQAVPDGVPGMGSNFANAFNEALEKRASAGYAMYRVDVFPNLDDLLGAKQPPIDAPFPGGVMDGDFVFVKGGKLPPTATVGPRS